MQGFGSRGRIAGTLLVMALVLGGCAQPRNPAPVEDRSATSRPPTATVTPALPGGAPITTDANGKPLPGIENYGKPGYYAVRPGDTIMRIGLETGQNWRDIVKWNNLENANLIEVGQVLRVIPPVGGATVAAVTPTVPATTDNSAVTKPVTPQPSVVPATGAMTPGAAPAATAAGAAATAAAAAASKPAPPVAASGDDDVGWIWPAQGQLIAGFDESRNKGLDIGGRAGDAVLAAADGRVVYAGAGLRGYGNLIILKHNNTYLTAYAHNQALLVKEDQSVQKGQKIAEMGNSDADRVKLHFEIRRQGKPVDPARYLPTR
ncbi:peptidoglycan DD-metalloendopeptidase family protein [Variovorax sp. J22R133]|uniref:peptidoglycan DD-metalloendopeptidase family protein n=1 Tax=Variovorax brevis TaxID=3053503 RepID=UPI002575C5F1|nr:peptidoglycan DD-metalloendopeptidase family protein [Variovorax sp. J22R133]MDM0113193.1 peptidoglycan DD-metalloendopeptidase family protein [Variovorax sp. J22R133]